MMVGSASGAPNISLPYESAAPAAAPPQSSAVPSGGDSLPQATSPQDSIVRSTLSRALSSKDPHVEAQDATQAIIQSTKDLNLNAQSLYMQDMDKAQKRQPLGTLMGINQSIQAADGNKPIGPNEMFSLDLGLAAVDPDLLQSSLSESPANMQAATAPAAAVSTQSATGGTSQSSQNPMLQESTAPAPASGSGSSPLDNALNTGTA